MLLPASRSTAFTVGATRVPAACGWTMTRFRPPNAGPRAHPLRAWCAGPNLCPHDGGMNALRKRALRKTAIGAAHDVLAPDDVGEPHEALRHEFGMLDDIGGM